MYLTLSMKRSSGVPVTPSMPELSLDAAGLVALADLTTIQQRTALTGNAVILDALVLCPGIHMQQDSTNLNGGEYPACGGMDSGYVFRVENPATVYYLQQVGTTGHLTTLTVSPIDKSKSWYGRAASVLFWAPNTPLIPALAYGAAVLWTIVVIVVLGLSHDWWALGVIFMLIASRLCNVIVIRRRAKPGWHGEKEPNKYDDLLILLSQDRWIRIKGEVDHLKAITSGQWLRDQRTFEGWATALATMVVYLAAALVSNATRFGQALIITLLAGSVGLLAVTNSTTYSLVMHGHMLRVVAPEPVKYDRRLDLVDALVKETGRDEWANRMGIDRKSTSTHASTTTGQPVIM